MRSHRTPATLATAIAVAMTLLVAGPAAADAVRRQQLAAPISSDLTSGLSTSLAEDNLKSISGLTMESRRAYDSSWNRYSYGLNNPLKYTDPDGQIPVIPIVIGFIFAVAGGAEYANTPTGPQDPVLTNPQYENSGGMRALAAASKGAAVGVFIDQLIASHDSEKLPLDRTVPSHRPTVQENKAKGDAFRDEIAGGMGQEGFGVNKEVRKETPFGPRVIDIEVSKDGEVKGGIETKAGKSPYKPSQRAKDEYLRRQGYPVDVVRDK